VDLTRYFGIAIRNRRNVLGLSQEELAERSGLDRTYVSGVERGTRNPTLRVLQRLAHGLNSELDVLLKNARQLGERSRHSAR